MTGPDAVPDAVSGAVSSADLLGLAVEVAAEAAALVHRMRHEGVDVAGTKTSATDVVTAADHASEELIRERLLAARPGDGFLGEEGHDSAGTTGVRWIVDPIDGTVNYLYGAPHYAVSIAVEHEGRTVAGVVHAPALGEVYTATLGGGAFRNGDRLPLRTAVPLDRLLVATGFNYVPGVRARQVGYLAGLLPQVRDIRRYGSAALDLCAVASGRVDAYVEEGTHPWDDAAGGLVAAETGATFAVHRSVDDHRVAVAAPTETYPAFEALARRCGFFV